MVKLLTFVISGVLVFGSCKGLLHNLSCIQIELLKANLVFQLFHVLYHNIFETNSSCQFNGFIRNQQVLCSLIIGSFKLYISTFLIPLTKLLIYLVQSLITGVIDGLIKTMTLLQLALNLPRLSVNSKLDFSGDTHTFQQPGSTNRLMNISFNVSLRERLVREKWWLVRVESLFGYILFLCHFP